MSFSSLGLFHSGESLRNVSSVFCAETRPDSSFTLQDPLIVEAI
jgi:hypothetical protein